ncbi:MAG: arginine--tRNA ligase [Oscillospiraceae bacterium]|nr:arginine--tRNA ligase [Oscillospiraceae bacterium]
MKLLVDLISAQLADAFEKAGYDASYGKAALSNRPDLCEFQCNGCMPAAKVYKKAPLQIAQAVAEQLADSEMFSMAEAVAPGFLNLRVKADYLAEYLSEMRTSERFGVEAEREPRTIVVDYGGPNVAKPLHVGHLRSAIIGESVKRIYRFFGNKVIGDIHLGDWGLQMGLIIEEVRERQPDLPYFDENFTGEYPETAPFTIGELEEIYPTASAKSKVDEAFAERAHNATYLLQSGVRGYRAMWEHILRVSVEDLKKNYANLNVSFDAWLGESDAQPYIPAMLDRIREQGLAVESEGALVVPVQEESDTKEIPPCILIKSDGATLYATTDLATLVQREEDFHPDKVFYLTDKRQNLHFEQVFRTARKAGLVRAETELEHVGFGTMNGKDGKPFKTREGGVMRLERLIAEINDYVTQKITENQNVSDEELPTTAKKIALAALKYGDLSNLATKDYIFDLDRFTSFEGNTGPYILYTIVRIKSILAKFDGDVSKTKLLAAESESQKELMLVLSRLSDNLRTACRDSAPNAICAYIYELAVAANKFYHDTRIISEADRAKLESYIALIDLTRSVLETCIDLLGFDAPDKM